ncbi:hypothetical protein AM571_PA00337 (plasmid) [Rhizobium etli 8C-3]|uniref:Uncharacterized protein n=1 Tax=Rhizobium etli 8C-3 TaxID=538025 RepID=A0A1L5PAM2_RHIET|nr:hypothetical protein AM571_PA00337 [Rhizobium etli 8C-3]
MISQQTFAIIKAETRVPVAIPVDVAYLEEKAEALDQSCAKRPAGGPRMPVVRIRPTLR